MRFLHSWCPFRSHPLCCRLSLSQMKMKSKDENHHLSCNSHNSWPFWNSPNGKPYTTPRTLHLWFDNTPTIFYNKKWSSYNRQVNEPREKIKRYTLHRFILHQLIINVLITVSCFRSPRFKCLMVACVSYLLKNLYLDNSSAGSSPFLFSLMPESASHINTMPWSVSNEHDRTSREIKECWNLIPTCSSTSSLISLKRR